MRILSKYKDYYDWVVSKYGEDSNIFYDRRDAYVIESRPKKPEVCNADTLFFFSKNPIEKKWYNFYNGRFHNTEADTIEPRSRHFILQVGFMEYVFKVTRVLSLDNSVNVVPEMVSAMRQRRLPKVFDKPIYIVKVFYNPHVSTDYQFSTIDKSTPAIVSDYEYMIENPILKDTWISSMISAEDMWTNISEFIGAQVDKEFVDTRTDAQKAESAGFDKVTSFRKM